MTISCLRLGILRSLIGMSKQVRDPASFIECHDRLVYEPRQNFGRMRKGVGVIKLTDFGLAVVHGDVDRKLNHDIQSLEFAVTEVCQSWLELIQ